MYFYEIVSSLQQTLNKISKRDKQSYEQILKKIQEIINCVDIEHYKNLRGDMKDRKRVHISHFVLIFKFIREENKIIFLEFDHHDNIYKN